MVSFPKHLAARRRALPQSETNSILITEPPQLEKVTWYREPHLRKLYLLSLFLLMGSATSGYDSMMVNTSQQMNKWNEYFPEVADTNKLGILINMYNIGSIVSYFVAPYLADNLGRKSTIQIGCVFMIGGALISGLCNGYGSEPYSLTILIRV